MEEILAGIVGLVIGLWPWAQQKLRNPSVQTGLKIGRALTPFAAQLADKTGTNVDDVVVSTTSRVLSEIDPKASPRDIEKLQSLLREGTK